MINILHFNQTSINLFLLAGKSAFINSFLGSRTAAEGTKQTTMKPTTYTSADNKLVSLFQIGCFGETRKERKVTVNVNKH